jgi:hypothetical protein
MEVKGKIKLVKETQEVSGTFKKREFVVTTEEQYPQDIIMEFTQDKCSLLDGVSQGDEVTAHINLRGREWINPQGVAQYFNTIQCWKIEKNSNF